LVNRIIKITSDLSLESSLLFRTDFKSSSFDLSGILFYQDRIWGGLNLKRSEALGLLAGYSFLEDNKLNVGYSFDYVLVERDLKQPTSHEVFVRYKLPNIVIGGRKAVKTPRFIF